MATKRKPSPFEKGFAAVRGKKPVKRPARKKAPAPFKATRGLSLSQERTKLSKARKKSSLTKGQRSAIEKRLSEVVHEISFRAGAHRRKLLDRAISNVGKNFPNANERSLRKGFRRSSEKTLKKAAEATYQELVFYASSEDADDFDYDYETDEEYNPFWYHE